MKKVFSRVGYMLVILSMILSSFVAINVFAEEEYTVTANFDKSLGNVSLTNMTADTADLSAATDKTWWKAKGAISVADELMPSLVAAGGSLSPMIDLDATGSGSYSIEGESFTNYVAHATENGLFTEGKITGSSLKFVAPKSGILSVYMVDVGEGKELAVCEEGTESKEKSLYYFKPAAKSNLCASVPVKAGKTYYAGVLGSKGRFVGASFEESISIDAKAGDAIKITSVPNADSLVLGVSLSDESVELQNNDDFTECTFVMPSGNVDIDVTFSDVVGEVRSIKFDEIKGNNASESQVDDDLALFDGWNTKIGYADVAWESSNQDVISISGEVNALKVDTNVDFSAVFTFQDYPNITIKRVFKLTVLADTDDLTAVAAAKESLTIGDTSAVKKDLELPIKGRKNTTVSWQSSDLSIVDETGKVTRYPKEDKTVTLTATISRGTASDTKTFNVLVVGYEPLEIERVAFSNANGDIVMKPVDGGYLSHIVYMDDISNKTGQEQMVVAVYDKSDEQRLIDCKSYTLADITAEPGVQQILYLTSDEVPVDSNSLVKIFAFDGFDTVEPLMDKAFVATDEMVAKPTLYVVGDSTASNYDAEEANNRFPQTGWAQIYQDFFESTVVVKNLALSGRSSKSFRTEANYRTLVNNIKPGDYLIIQFGHNDEKTGDNVHTDVFGDRFTDGSYKHSLTNYYIDIALEKGANPIIATSISRRRLSDTGLEAYVNAARDLGQELGLPVLDLYAKTNGYINSVGLDSSIDIFNHVKPRDSRFVDLTVGKFSKSQFYADGTTDNTHINYFGAQIISQWACDELEKISHPLITRRSSHTMKLEDIPPYADAISK